MSRRLHLHPVSIALFAALLLATTVSCRKREAPADAPPAAATPGAPAPAAAIRVTDVQLGNAIGTDKKVTDARETFSPKDTIFASVATDGSANATLRAKWTYQDGQTVEETSRSISPTGPALTEFSIQKPDGLPAGDYRVEIFRDGQSAATRSFKVQ